jgi:hypothetical protein
MKAQLEDRAFATPPHSHAYRRQKRVPTPLAPTPYPTFQYWRADRRVNLVLTPFLSSEPVA